MPGTGVQRWQCGWPVVGVVLLSVAACPGRLAAAEVSGSGTVSMKASGKKQLKPMTEAELAEQKRKVAAREAEAKRLREESQKNQRDQLEKLRTVNPEAYRTSKKLFDRMTAMNNVVNAYNAGTLDEAVARKQLTPLVKEEAAETLAVIDERIAGLQQTMQDMQQLKKDQEAWVKRQVDLRLGVATQSQAASPASGTPAKPVKRQ